MPSPSHEGDDKSSSPSTWEHSTRPTMEKQLELQHEEDNAWEVTFPMECKAPARAS